MDTIYALASAQGKSGVAVVRVSGPAAHDVVLRLAGSVPEPRRASLRHLVASDGSLLDHGLVITFDQSASFTGERTAEFYIHGSIAIVRALLQELSQHAGLRQADPGEFTRRALEGGRLGLTEVEGLADLIEAETEAQRRLALRIFEGEFGRRISDWRGRLVQALSLLAASIDFADEEIPDDILSEIGSLIGGVRGDLQKEITGMSSAERIRDGFEVAIVGPPNIGKSTLLNALAGREAALTSEVAGTTRDVIEVRMDLSGLPVTFLDTAGLRETDDLVEGLGIERALQRAKSADLRVVLVDGTVPAGLSLTEGDLVLQGKCDLAVDGAGVSGKTGAGVDELLQAITRQVHGFASGASLATQERHRIAMTNAISALDDAIASIVGDGSASELLSEDLRRATMSLDVLVGKVDVEDLLDVIFSKFFLGK
jgi:tRNA modification GTPase